MQTNPNDDPNDFKTEFVLEAGGSMMRLLEGAYSCITLVKGVSQRTQRNAAGLGLAGRVGSSTAACPLPLITCTFAGCTANLRGST